MIEHEKNWVDETVEGTPFSHFQNKIDYNYSMSREMFTVKDIALRFYQTGKINSRRFLLLCLLLSYLEPKGFRASNEWIRYMLKYDSEEKLEADLVWMCSKGIVGFHLDSQGVRWIGVNCARLDKLIDKFGDKPAMDLIEDYERGQSYE
jgi:hypothetical protein